LGIYELFELSERYCEMIVRMESAEEIRKAASEQGMMFLVNDGVRKIREGMTTVEEIARVAGRA